MLDNDLWIVNEPQMNGALHSWIINLATIPYNTPKAGESLHETELSEATVKHKASSLAIERIWRQRSFPRLYDDSTHQRGLGSESGIQGMSACQWPVFTIRQANFDRENVQSLHAEWRCLIGCGILGAQGKSYASWTRPTLGRISRDTRRQWSFWRQLGVLTLQTARCVCEGLRGTGLG
jgi:hypothetical protein